MGHVIVYRGEMGERWYRHYLLVVSRWLLKRGTGIDSVPRTRSNGRWLYVFDDKDKSAAEELVTRLRQETEDDGWELAPAEGTPDVGPLQPIVVELGWDNSGIGFGLDSIIAWALRLRHPGAVPHEDIWITTNQKSAYTKDGVRQLVAKLLPVLTGLSEAELLPFGGFEIVDPVKETAIVPFTPFQTSASSEGQAGTPRHCETETSPDRCNRGVLDQTRDTVATPGTDG